MGAVLDQRVLLFVVVVVHLLLALARVGKKLVKSEYIGVGF